MDGIKMITIYDRKMYGLAYFGEGCYGDSIIEKMLLDKNTNIIYVCLKLSDSEMKNIETMNKSLSATREVIEDNLTMFNEDKHIDKLTQTPNIELHLTTRQITKERMLLWKTTEDPYNCTTCIKIEKTTASIDDNSIKLKKMLIN